MATKTLTIDGNCISQTCGSVIICLRSTWATKTQSGVAAIVGNIITVNKISLTGVSGGGCAPVSCCSPHMVVPVPPAPTCSMCRYEVSYDDSQMAIDPGNSLPYVFTSADVESLEPYGCAFGKVFSAIQAKNEYSRSGSTADLYTATTALTTGQTSTTVSTGISIPNPSGKTLYGIAIAYRTTAINYTDGAAYINKRLVVQEDAGAFITRLDSYKTFTSGFTGAFLENDSESIPIPFSIAPGGTKTFNVRTEVHSTSGGAFHINGINGVAYLITSTD